MSDTDKGYCRAEGAIDALVARMSQAMKNEGRSQEYIDAFWENFYSYCGTIGKDD